MMKKVTQKQEREIMRSRRALYKAESLVDFQNLNLDQVNQALNALNHGLAKHIKRTTFERYGIHQVVRQWVKSDKTNPMHSISGKALAKMMRDIAHQINQKEMSIVKGKHSFEEPSDLA